VDFLEHCQCHYHFIAFLFSRRCLLSHSAAGDGREICLPASNEKLL
jgi:hypothetical protein